MRTPSTILIIGGGIAGLAAAAALRRRGIDAHVFEQAPEVREIGAGLSVWGNGLTALDRLGALDHVLRDAAPIYHLDSTDWRGRVLQRCPIGWLGHHIAIQRPHLLAALLRLLPAGAIHTNRRLVAATEDDAGVTARFADGSEARGGALIGADGLWSVVRSMLDPGCEPVYAGHIAWRGIADFAHERWPVGIVVSAMGRGKHFAVEPLRDGVGTGRTSAGDHAGPTRGRVFWYATCMMPVDAPVPPPDAVPHELARIFSDTHDPIPALIAATPAANIIRNRVYDLPAPFRWCRGRIAIIGDAAHAMRPNLGQGACQALEDAVILADCLAGAADIPGALRRFQHRRRRRARWIVYWSRQISRLEHLDTPRSCALRDVWLRCLNPGMMNLPWFWTIVRFHGAPDRADGVERAVDAPGPH